MPDDRGLSAPRGSSSRVANRQRRRVLVTGANGFIGSNLCAALARDKMVDVIGLVRTTSDLTFLSGLEKVKITTGEITDRNGLSAAMQGVSLVYHVAARVADWGPRAEFAASNVLGVANILAEARRNGVSRVVHVSSVSVYGFPGGANLRETTRFTPRPADAYISTKAEGDRLAMQYNSRGIETVVIRPGAVYGPNDRTTTLKLARALVGGSFAYVDGGRHILSPVYVQNLIELILRAGHSDCAPGQAFNAVDDGYVSWRQFIESFCEELGCAPPRLSLPAAVAWPLATSIEAAARAVGSQTSPFVNRYRLRSVMQDNHFSNEKARRMLGWRPSVATREGIRRAAHWYLDVTSGHARHGAVIPQ